MMFAKGTHVRYRQISGPISFVTQEYVCILVKKGLHKSADVNVIVPQANYNQLIIIEPDEV